MTPILYLVFANVFIVLSTSLLQYLSLNHLPTILILGLANSLAGISLLVFHQKPPHDSVADLISKDLSKTKITAMTFRVFSYLCVYLLFVFYAKEIELSFLISIQTVTPFFAMYLLTSVAPKHFSKLRNRSDFFKVFILFSIMITQLVFETKKSAFIPISIIGLIFLGSTMNQVSAKVLAKFSPILWNSSRYLIFTGLILIVFAFTFDFRNSSNYLSLNNILFTLALGVSALSTQYLFTKGLELSSPSHTSIGVGTIVPLSIFFQWSFHLNKVKPIYVVLSCILLAYIFAETFIFRAKYKMQTTSNTMHKELDKVS